METVAFAPAACKRAVDEDIESEIGAFGSQFVGRDHMIDECFDKSRLIGIKKRVARAGRCHGRLLRRVRGLRQAGGGGCSYGAAGDGALEEFTPVKIPVFHMRLHDLY
jgi:hypothetical protein